MARNLIFIIYSSVRLLIEEQEIIHQYNSYKYQVRILKLFFYFIFISNLYQQAMNYFLFIGNYIILAQELDLEDYVIIV